MRIGELAKHTGVSVRALRHYCELGLLSPIRHSNQYREFGHGDIERVRLIRLFLSVGFCLEEIRDYAPCWCSSEAENVSSNDIRAFYTRKLAELDAQLADMQVVRARLLLSLGVVGPLEEL